MALRNIVKDGDPVLTKQCRPVTEFNDRLAQMLDDMAETMMEEEGLGLAAPQIGILRRVFVALDERSMPDWVMQDEDEEEEDLSDVPEEEIEVLEWEPEIIEFINPEIISTEGEIKSYEGCLSFPGKFGAIKRPQKVKVRAFDRHGNPFEMEVEGTLARCVCHETDHLNGVTIADLAEYFYDPEVPHELDEEITGECQQTMDEDLSQS